MPRIVTTTVCTLLILGCGWSAAHAPRPNIVLILADDLGYADLGCYGNRYHQTPHMDRLMGAGMRFTQAYSDAPLCAPSRIALLTGRHAVREGCYEVVAGRFMEQVEIEKVPLMPPENRLRLPTDRKILPERLKALGYRTGVFGKWHVGPQSPAQRGFDDYVLLNNNSHLDVAKSATKQRSPDYPEPCGYSSDYLTACARRFLDKGKGDARPFFLYLPYTLVHTCLGPSAKLLEPKSELLAKYAALPKSELHSNPSYAAMVEALDQSVGEVIAELDRRQLLSNTIIILTSDNGGLLGKPRRTKIGIEAGDFTSNYPLRDGKATIWEGGIRIPFGLRFDGRMPAGRVSDAVVSQLDLMPTLLELAGDPEAGSVANGFDGRSLLPLFSGQPPVWPERALCWHYPNYRLRGHGALEGDAAPGGQRPSSALRRGDWKLIESLEDGSCQLYKLAADVSEQRDISRAHPETVAQLKAELAAWREETRAPMPVKKITPTKAAQQPQQRLLGLPGGEPLCLEAKSNPNVWRSDPMTLDARRDYRLSARLRAQAIEGGVAEFYLEALDTNGKVLGMLGKGWPAYRSQAGVAARGSGPWTESQATVRRMDIPAGTVKARAVCAVRVETSPGGSALFDDIACRPAEFTTSFLLEENGRACAGRLGRQGEPVVLVFSVVAPDHAGRSLEAHVTVRGYFGAALREADVAIPLDATGAGELRWSAGRFERTGWFEVRLALRDGRELSRSAFGIVDPALDDARPDPDSPYAVNDINSKDLEIAQRAGMKWVRFGAHGLQWGHVEPEKGRFHDARLEGSRKQFELLRSHGILGGMMFGGWFNENIPPWARRPVEGGFYDDGLRVFCPRGNYSLPADLGAWQSYVKRVVGALAGKAAAWEVWNENDIPQFWQGSIEDYMTLLRATSEAVRAADPKARVAMCGISTTLVGQEKSLWFEKWAATIKAQHGIVVNPRQLLETVLRDGRDWFDIVNYHPYGSIEEIEKGCRIVRELAVKHGCGNKPFWITETGAGTHERGEFKASEKEQARLYWQIHAVARACGAERVYWLEFADLGRDRSFNWDNFGLVDFDRAPKPSLLAHAALARWLGNGKFRRELALGPGIRAFEFDQAGTPVTMTWSDQPRKLHLQYESPPVIRNLMGNCISDDLRLPRHDIVLGQDPILITGRVSLSAELANKE